MLTSKISSFLVLLLATGWIIILSGCVSGQQPLRDNMIPEQGQTNKQISTDSIDIKGEQRMRDPGEPDPVDFKQKLVSENFVIYYNNDGAEAASPEFAIEVRDALEFSYNKLVDSDGFRAPLFLPINIYLTGKSMDMMGSVKGNGPKGIYGRFNPKLRDDKDVQPGNSVFAHELFHAIQKSYDETEGRWLVEATANWAAYEVYPEENFWAKRGTGWLIWPDLKDFEQIEYESGTFWVWFAGKYGSATIMKNVFEASVDYEGTYIIDKVLEASGKTFDDVWGEFAVALYTRDFADKNAADALYSQRSASGKKTLPVTVADLSWDGTPLILDKVQNEYDSGGKNKGEPLQIVHGHGLAYIKIIPDTNTDLRIIFKGDEKTKFFVMAVGKKASSYTPFKFLNSQAIIQNPGQFDEVMLVITRSKEGTGYYSIELNGSVTFFAETHIARPA